MTYAATVPERALRERAKADYAALQERLATIRGNATRRAAMLADNADTVRNFKGKKAPSRDRRIVAEERLVDVLAELREKNVRMGAEEREAEAEAKRVKAEQKAERKRAIEERKAALREDKQLQTEQKQAQEEELKMRQTDVRALQVLNLKARQASMEKDQHAEAVRRKRIDEKLEKALDIIIAERTGKAAALSERKDNSDSDSENVDPVGEWQV